MISASIPASAMAFRPACLTMALPPPHAMTNCLPHHRPLTRSLRSLCRAYNNDRLSISNSNGLMGTSIARLQCPVRGIEISRKTKGAPSMTAPVLQAISPFELMGPKIPARHPGFAQAFDADTKSVATRPDSFSCTLDLSASRAHDAALDILGVYKLTGNFHINLEIVLKDLAVFDKVTYEIEPESLPPFRSDC